MTVSPGSTAPLAGAMLSAVSRALAAWMLTKGSATNVLTEAELLAVLASASAPEMLTVQVASPAFVINTCTFMVTTLPSGRLPASQVMILPAWDSVVPGVELELITWALGGKVWLMNTAVAVLGPRLVALTV